MVYICIILFAENLFDLLTLKPFSFIAAVEFNMEKRISCNWSDLPEDLIKMIARKLNLADQNRLVALSKHWEHSALEEVGKDYYLPWSIRHLGPDYKNGVYLFHTDLYDPHSAMEYRVLSQIYLFSLNSDVFILGSKRGCVLLAGRDTPILLHNPFKNRYIILPELGVDRDADICGTMSTDPSCPGCQIIIFSRDIMAYLAISILSLEEADRWHTYYVRLQDEVEGNFMLSMVYLLGRVYCLFDCGKVTSYCLEQKVRTLLPMEAPRPCKKWCYLGKRDANLLLIWRSGDNDEDITILT